MSSGQANSMTSAREMAKIQARANLLLALYSHVSDDLERSRVEARTGGDLLRSQLGDVRRELEQAHRQLDATTEEAHRGRSELHRLSNHLADNAARTTQLQQQYDALLASTSWRITAPIRAMARVMKRQ